MLKVEATVATAIEAMQQDVRDRLADDMYEFYSDELGELPARKVCNWSPLDIISRYKTYKLDEHNAWEEKCQEMRQRHEEEWRAGEEQRAQRKGFFGTIGGMFGDALTTVGKWMSFPTEPEQMSDEEAMRDISLIQRYLRSVAQPGQKPLHLPPTVSKALSTYSMPDTEVYTYMCDEWGRRGVEEIARIGNDQIYQGVTQDKTSISTEEQQEMRKQIKLIMQFLRQKSNQYPSNQNKGRRS